MTNTTRTFNFPFLTASSFGQGTIRPRIVRLVRPRASFTPCPLYSSDCRLDGSPLVYPVSSGRGGNGGERSRKLRSSKFDGGVVTLDGFNISEYAVRRGFTPRRATPRYATPCHRLDKLIYVICGLACRGLPPAGPDKFTLLNFLVIHEQSYVPCLSAM